MFVYNGLTTLCGVFILHLLRKARGCCMHVFSSINSIIWRVIAHRIVHGDLLRSKSVKKFLFTTLYSREQSNTLSPLRRSSLGDCVYMENSQPGHPRSRVSRGGISLRRVSLGIRAGSPNINSPFTDCKHVTRNDFIADQMSQITSEHALRIYFIILIRWRV
jgi:hypothetical protein